VRTLSILGWNIFWVFLLLVFVPFNIVPSEFSERAYVQAMLIGIVLIIVNTEFSFRRGSGNSHVNPMLLRDVGYLLLISGLTPYLPFPHNPVNIVPLMVYIGVL